MFRIERLEHQERLIKIVRDPRTGEELEDPTDPGFDDVWIFVFEGVLPHRIAGPGEFRVIQYDDAGIILQILPFTFTADEAALVGFNGVE